MGGGGGIRLKERGEPVLPPKGDKRNDQIIPPFRTETI